MIRTLVQNVRIVSDLHYEFFQHTIKAVDHALTIRPKNEDVLILAGDVCIATTNYGEPSSRLKDILKAFKTNWTHVLFVPGNHEYYHACRGELGIDDVDRIMEKICDEVKVTFLQRKTCEIDGIKFAGCTLWSNAQSDDLQHTNDVGKAFNTPNEFLNAHLRDLEFVKSVKPDVMITHYLPSFRCVHHRFATYAGNKCFATDLEELIVPPMQHWVHGHTHEAVKERINNVQVTANPYGYPGERRMTSFDDTTIKITKNVAY